jgi:pSer/pThr/pTyr-binding forkhead associated (FHA) protein
MNTTARIFSKTGELSEASYPFSGEAVIGSDSGCTISLSGTDILPEHARIWFEIEQGAFYLEDLSQTSATTVDGVPVLSTVRLDELNIITLSGQHDLIFAVTPSGSEPITIATPPAAAEKPTESAADQSPDDAMQRTQIGTELPPLPSLEAPDTDEKPDERPGEKPDTATQTRVGGGLAPLPSLDATETDDSTHTRIGGDMPPLPSLDLPGEEETIAKEKIDDTMHTRAGGSLAPLPSIEAFEAQDSEPPKSPSKEDKMESSTEAGAGVTAEFKNAAGAITSVKLHSGEQFVGRSPECRICIDDPSLSRKHARIVVEGDLVSIEDLGSKNRTFVDGSAIDSLVTISSNSEVRLGHTVELLLKTTED